MWKYRERGEHLEVKGEEVLDWRMNIPYWEVPIKREKWLNFYYKKVEEVWEQRWTTETYWKASLDLQEKRELSRIFIPWTASLTGEVFPLATKGIAMIQDYTVVITVSERCGKQMPTLRLFSEQWQEGIPQSKKKKLLELGWSKKRIIDKLTSIIRGKEDFLLLPHWEKRLIQYFSYDHSYITEDEVVIYYPQGTVAGRIEGVPRFVISQKNIQYRP